MNVMDFPNNEYYMTNTYIFRIIKVLPNADIKIMLSKCAILT